MKNKVEAFLSTKGRDTYMLTFKFDITMQFKKLDVTDQDQ
jgi:hypothetical protein